MTGQPEDRRAVLVERLAQVIDANAACPTCTCGGDCRAGTAEAALSLLEGAETGYRVVAEGDLQETVGVVLAQLREARAEIERLQIIEIASIGAHALLDDANEEINTLRGEVAQVRAEAQELASRLAASRTEVAELRGEVETISDGWRHLVGQALDGWDLERRGQVALGGAPAARSVEIRREAGLS